MANYVVNGGKKLRGEITVSGSKNAAVALLCAVLLNKGKTVLANVSRIEEVRRMIEILQSLGARVSWTKPKELTIVPPLQLSTDRLNKEAFVKTRAALMYMGVLSHFIPKYSLPMGGGCKLGKRTVAPYILALQKLGITIKTYKDLYLIETELTRGPIEIVMSETSDTATEVVLMAAARRPGKTVIKFCSPNYQVQDVCFFLQKLGVKISGVGTHVLIVEGLKNLDKTVRYEISEDPIEAMSLLSLAITTHSSLTIRRAPIDFLARELVTLEAMGFTYDVLKKYKAANGRTNLIDFKTQVCRLKALEDKIHPLPYPGINIDNLPFFVPLATQAKGRTLIHDWVYEERAIYYPMMKQQGANVELADIYRAYITGPTEFRPAEFVSPPILRCTMIILIGMIAARGRSVLRNVYAIERGYENFTERLRSIGVDIQRVD